MRKCSIDGCDNSPHIRGWCRAHYKRFMRYGSPVLGRTPKGELTRYLETVVFSYQDDDCLLWPFSRTSKGRPAEVYYQGKYQSPVRLVCELENGPATREGLDAAHSCGNGHLGCVTRRHLRWATRQENAADMVAHGRSVRGERHKDAKLTEAQVREIRRLKGVLSQREIAKRFEVTKNAVAMIHHGKSWGWLDGIT